MSVPWSSLNNGVSTVAAPGPPDRIGNAHVKAKRKDKLPKKLEQKLKEFDSHSSETSDSSDGKDSSIKEEWNPMKDDYASPSFNSYSKGVGALLRPTGAPSKCNYTLFVDNIPVALTRDGLCNLFSRCGKVLRVSIVKNDNPVTTYGFIEYGTIKEADAALQQLDGFDMGKGIRLKVQVSEKHSKGSDENKGSTYNRQSFGANRREQSSKVEDHCKRSFNGSEIANHSPKRFEHQSLSASDSISSKEEDSTSLCNGKFENLPPYSFGPKGRGFSRQSNGSYDLGKHTNNAQTLSCSLGSMQQVQLKEGIFPHSSLPSQLNLSANNSNDDKQLMTPVDFGSISNGADVGSKEHDQSSGKSFCNYCGKPSNKKCAVCRTPYCGLECQTNDWSTHKFECKKIVEESCERLASEDPLPKKEKLPINQDESDAYQQLDELCGLMTHVNVDPSALMPSKTLTPPDSPLKPNKTNLPNQDINVGNNDSMNKDSSQSSSPYIAGRKFRMSYSDMNAAFGIIPPSTTLPVVDIACKILPSSFYGFVTNIMVTNKLFVFPLHVRSKDTIMKFLNFESNQLGTVQPVNVLPNYKKLFGYKNGNKQFQRVEVNSSTTLISSYDTGELLGNLNMSQLFVLPDEFANIPSLRLKLTLCNIEVPSGKQAASKGKNFLIEQVLGKIVKVNDPDFLDHLTIGTLFSADESVNYNKLLIDNGYASLRNAKPTSTSPTAVKQNAKPTSTSTTSVKQTSMITHKCLSEKVPFHLPPKDQYFEIYPTAVTSPDIIWAQVFHQHSDYLEKLLEDMNTMYQASNTSNYVPSVGELCAARFSFDGLYYRAEVIRINNNGLIDVQFVDYGNKETISLKDLHYLEPCFLSLSKQALCFALYGVLPSIGTNWNPEANMYLKDTILQQQVTVKIMDQHSGKYFVLVNGPCQPDIIINDELVQKGFAIKGFGKRGVKDKAAVSPKIGRGSAFNHPKSPGTQCTSPGTPGSVGNSSFKKAFVLSPIVSPRTSPSASGIVKQRLSTSGQDEGRGNSGNAQFNESDEREGKKHITNAATGSEDKSALGPQPQGSFGAKHFVSNSSGSQKKVCIPTTSLPFGAKSQVIVVHVESPSHFYVVTVSGTQELVKLSEAMQSFAHKPFGSSVDIGDFGVAKYSQDNCYGRVEVLKLKPNKALLRFVDYGNKQAILIRDLCVVDPQFSTLPQQAILCCLSGISDLDEKEAAKYFKKLVHNKPVDIEPVQIKEGNKHVVKLLVDSAQDVAGALMEQGKSTSLSHSPAVNVTQQPALFPSCSNLSSPVLTHQSPVVISDITSIDEFYVHVCNEETKVNIGKVVVAPSEFRQQPVSSQLPTNYLCCAKFLGDEQWYRACVTSSNNNGGYTVQFIDFGNYAEVSQTNISLCPDELSSLPILAARCSLYNVSQCDIDIFRSLTSDKVLIASVIKEPLGSNNKSWCISLTDTSGTSDVDIASCLKPQTATSVNVSSKADLNNTSKFAQQSVSSPVHNSSTSLLPVSIPSPQFPKPAERIKILLTDVSNPCKFYAQFLTSDCLQFFIQGLCQELPVAYANPSVYAGFKPNVGAYCCARFSQDGYWYRCKILEVSADSVRVFYIDYGNLDTVSVKDLYHLDPKFASVPSQAVLCSLVDISPSKGSQWSHTSVEYLKSVSSHPLFAVVDSVDSDVVNIELYTDESCSQSIGESLIENGLAVSDKSIQQLYSIPPFELPKNSSDCVVVVSDVTSFSSLYIQVALPEVQRNLAGLQSALGTYAKSSCLPPSYQPKVGDFCCALFGEDGCWYRAMITSVDKSKVKVVYVDFGNSSVVDVLDLRFLSEDFAKYPQVACHVALSGLASTPLSLLPAFRSLTDGKILNMKVVNCNSDPVEVELYDPDSAISSSINHQLISSASSKTSEAGKSFIEKPLPVISSPRVPVNNEFRCMVVHIDSLTKFYIQITEADNVHNLMQLMESINDCSRTASLVPTPLRVGQICLAQFSGDYYRGQILEVSGEHSRVHFIDFGNVDVVHCSCLREIPAHLLTLPAQALKCSLVGVSSGSAIDSETIKRFSVIGNIEVKCIVVNRHPLIVDLQKSDSSSTVSQSLALTSNRNCHFNLDKVVLPNSDKVVVMVTEVENPNILWMQLYSESALADFERMTIEMNHYCINSMPMETTPLFGQLCCAKFNADGTWYRGRVVNFAEDGEPNVQFVDFGNYQQTPASSLRDAPPSLLGLPAQAVPCMMNGQCEVEDYARISDLVLNKQFHCIQRDLSSSGLPLVDLFDLASGCLVVPS